MMESPELPKITLCMIVKNETAIIKECLESMCQYIDYWVICDTGSTDGTQDCGYSGNRWEDVEDYWSGAAEVWTGAGIALSDDTNDVSFCYIKNTGTANDLSVAVDGDNDYFILVPPGGSVQFRGGDADFNCDQVYMKAVGGSTTAEYIIAKK